ncbi:Fatty acid hydroxylase superfamily protein [Falsiruegeria litorea R37]|uniref:Fatty acid hydroxylase superfamily protein n=1 Tax=Falsiruegeria litorea R37 TaxID=1200284 RepID=A0A1Y5TX43_9RHOB|nr:sterol desaturase family protein [Falsiruegeria litorea]SLN72179.1 Fatty acid hydroxylase superfamily protein [Falsiruegeria litorea R37]
MEYLDQIGTIFSDFINPKKRIFVGYLVLSILIALAFLVVIRRSSTKGAVGTIFDRRVLFSRSAIADYKIFVINQVITMLVSPLLLTQIAIATAVFFFLHRFEFITSGQFENTSAPLVVALFSVTLFVVDDLTKYLLHRWMHRFPILWSIHKVHHSATTMTPITVYRVHPFEAVLYASRGALAQGPVVALFLFLFGSTVSLATVVGVNVLVFVFHVTGANLRHSHIQIGYWRWLEFFLISPAQHQIHHSVAKRHHDRNFGAALAIWDWMFGTLHLSQKEPLTFGLGGKEGTESEISSLYCQPVLDIVRISKRYLLAPFQRGRP